MPQSQKPIQEQVLVTPPASTASALAKGRRAAERAAETVLPPWALPRVSPGAALGCPLGLYGSTVEPASGARGSQRFWGLVRESE